MYFRKAFLILLLYFIIPDTGNCCFAQALTVQGMVQDTALKKPLQYGVAMALRFSDSLLLAFTRSDKNGNFKLEGLPVDTYQVMITHPQFGEQSFIPVLGWLCNAGARWC